MKLLLPLIFSLLLCLQASICFSQRADSLRTINPEALAPPAEKSTFNESEVVDSVQSIVKKKQPRDTIDYPFLSALSIYFDYPKLFSFFTEFENKAEIGIELQILKHILLRTELGRGRIQPRNFYKNVDYEVSGNYFRVGLGYTKTLGAKSRLSFGFNYGSSFFNDQGNIQIESPSGLFSSIQEPFRRTGLSGDWFELTFGTESHLGKNVYAGFTARVRKLNTFDSFEELEVLSIPGYGRTFDNSIPAINLYLKYRIQNY